jgi:ankyrin repeat protein
MEDKAGEFQKAKEMLTKSVEAIQKGNLDDLKALCGGSTEILNELSEGKGRKLIHFASIFGRIEILEWISENNGDPYTTDDDGNSISSLAVYNEDIKTLDWIITKYPDLLQHRNNKSMSLLHIASESCNFSIVEYLLGKGLDINEVSQNGTPLELTVMWKKIDMALFLIQHGADPNGSRGKYFPPCVVMAASMNNIKALEILITAGADLNLTGSDQVTALEVACEFGFDFIDFLIEKGAKITGRVIKAAYNNKKYEVVDKFLTIEPVEKIHLSREKSDEAEEFKIMGNEAFKNNDFVSAIDLYSKAIEIYPASIYYSNRSQAYINLKNYEEGLKDARTSRAIDSTNVKALLREAQALQFLGRPLESAGCYWHAQKQDASLSISSILLSTVSLIT